MPRATSLRTPLAFALPLALALLAAVSTFPTAGRAAVPPDRTARLEARVIAPAAGEKLQEAEVLFTFERSRAADQSRVVLMPREFDPTGWTSVPEIEGLVSRDASRGVLRFDETGIALSTESAWWWSVGSRDAATGAWKFTPARSFTVTPRFSNRLAPSPYLFRGQVGRMSDDLLRGMREEARLDQHGAAASSRGRDAALAAPRPRIRLAAGFDFDPALEAPAIPGELSMSRVRREPVEDEVISYLVQFTGEPDASTARAIAEAGGAIFSYIPDQAYLVRSTPAARERIEHLGATSWVGDWQPAFKLSPRADRQALAAASFEALLFPDADLAATVLELTALGMNVEETTSNGINKKLRFSASGDRLAAAAGVSGIAWIEPREHFELHNLNAQWVVQTNANGNRRVWDLGIKGEGQVVMTSDSGIHVTHNQFRDTLLAITTFGDYPTHRKIIAYKLGSSNPGVTFDDHAGASYHGTHTAGTIAGSDDGFGLDGRDGMAKNAKIYFMDISGTTLANSVDAFADLNDLFLPSYVGNGGGAARVSSNSWGSSAAGAYTLSAFEVDQFMWNHPDYYIAFSNGNSGVANSVGSPATAKNCASMGGTQNGTSANLIYSSTSRGPAADGRRKPTFCSPGQSVQSANGAGTTGYQSLSGTSMASPSGTGAVTLMRQYLTEGWYPTGAKVPANGFTPSAALLKSLAINSAGRNISGSTNPDNNIGFGRICADSALFFSGDTRKLLLDDFTTGLGAGQYVEYQVNVTDSLIPLKASLCWTDFPGSPSASVQLVNNLNLTVSKGANVYKGNVFVSGQSAQGGSYDALNVEELVHINFPFKGVWTVRVDAPSVPMGLQPFGIAITGGIGTGAGMLAMDRAEYGSSSTVQLRLDDADASGPINIQVTSPSEPGGETVSLTGSNGVFTGSLALAPTLPTAANGVLSVANGNLLTATYNDASPVATLIATGTVNFATPIITNVRATSLGPTGTLVTWTTDRNSTSRVYYGTTAGLELGTVDSVGYATAHKVLIPNTTAGQTYLYDVESVSLSGSSARDDLGGAHYRFTGRPSADILLLMSDAQFDRINTWNSALGNNAYDYETWTGSLAASPPLGDLNSGLRSYRGVVWQCGPGDYPPVSDTQRGVIDSYMSGGGRLWILGHDMGWGLADPTSPSYTAARAAWVQSGLHANYVEDPSTWSFEFGYAADPISGPYVGGVSYTPFGTGQAGDDVTLNAGAGTGTGVWFNNDTTPGDNVLRWISNSNNGSAVTALWGGKPSRILSSFLEFTAMSPPYTNPSAIRDTILNRSLQWLFGRERPTVSLSTPNGGENITASPANIGWNETVGPGQSIAARTIEYSIDSGDSWTVITTSAGASPYSWDLTGVPNSVKTRVRVRITDNGSPSLRAADASAADFTINLSGGDDDGPVVVSGSVQASTNPVVRGVGMTLTATVTDALTGGAAVDSAEWSFGPAPAAAGSGWPMSGTYGTPTVNATLAIDTQYFVLGNQKLWVRGRDGHGNWGAAASMDLLVLGTGTTDVPGGGGIPAVAFLGQNAPNPAAGPTSIAFGLPRGGDVSLDVFDPQGRLVKHLARGFLPAGVHQARWDGRDQNGARLGAGLYFYRLVTPDGRFEKRMALLQ